MTIQFLLLFKGVCTRKSSRISSFFYVHLFCTKNPSNSETADSFGICEGWKAATSVFIGGVESQGKSGQKLMKSLYNVMAL